MYTHAHVEVAAWGAGIPADHRRRLELVREEFRAKSDREYWVADWWGALRLDDRRMLCTLAGLDNSEEFVNRRWERLSDGSRDAICSTARQWARKLAVMCRI
jgi:hypothetical protein